MAVIASKVKEGTLTFGTTPKDFSCQAINVRIEPNHESEDGVETLCGDREPDSLTTSYGLMGSLVQDFTAVSGFVEYTYTNNGVEVAFEFTPTSAAAPKVAGTCQIRAVVYGGDVSARATSDFEFPIVTGPTFTWPAGP